MALLSGAPTPSLRFGRRHSPPSGPSRRSVNKQDHTLEGLPPLLTLDFASAFKPYLFYLSRQTVVPPPPTIVLSNISHAFNTFPQFPCFGQQTPSPFSPSPSVKLILSLKSLWFPSWVRPNTLFHSLLLLPPPHPGPSQCLDLSSA